MPKLVVSASIKVCRVLSLVILAVLLTIILVRFAPGYFSDEREIDAQHASETRVEVASRQATEATLSGSIGTLIAKWRHGDLGTSRQFEVPVSQLLRERVLTSARLLAKALALGWLLSLCAALPLSARRTHRGDAAIALASGALLCVPIALLATVCLVANVGGPVFILGTLIAVRDFKILYRVTRGLVRSSHFLYARSQGFSFLQATRVHLFRTVRADFVSLMMASLVVALSAVVPVEVIFDQPGLGQLAWSAAMNRDLPTLLAVTVLMAGLIGIASVFSETESQRGVSVCA